MDTNFLQEIFDNPDKADAEFSLYQFTRQAWHILHPTTPFVEGWAVGAVAEHLQAVTEGQISRLLINIPPGCTKSMLSNVFWPSWEWGPQGMPEMQYINASYDKRLAVRDMLHTRDLISSEWFQERWPIEWKDDDRGKEKFSNMNRGFRYATSVGGGLTGWRAQRFIIDDPHSVQLAESDTERSTAGYWFTETTPTRFTDPKKPVYVVIMQRLHASDISGVIINGLALEQDWTVLTLPMEFEPEYRSWTCVPSKYGQARMEVVRKEGDPVLRYVPSDDGEMLYLQDPRTKPNELLWPERYDRPAVDDLKIQLTLEGGDYAVACQLQQRPVPREGGMFKCDQISFVDAPLEGAAVRGWDLAASKDKTSPYTVGVKLILANDGRLCISHCVRLRGDADEVRDAIKAAAIQDGVDCPQDIPQDPGQAGKAQCLQFAKDLHGYDVRFSPESGDKQQRAEPLSAQVNAGNVCMVRGPWNDTLLAELGLFPGSTFKDQVDALSRAYHHHLKNIQDPISLFGPRLITDDDY